MPESGQSTTGSDSGGDIVRLDFAREIEVARLGPRQLSRARAREAARRDQLDHGADSGDRPDPLADVVAQPPAFVRVGYAAVNEYCRGLLARRTGDCKS